MGSAVLARLHVAIRELRLAREMGRRKDQHPCSRATWELLYEWRTWCPPGHWQ